MPNLRRRPLLSLVLLMAACSPSLNWREVRPEGSGLTLMFPCKPELLSRALEAPGAPASARMGLAHCEAAGLSFSLSWSEVPDPTQVAPALVQMREALLAGLKLPAAQPLALQVPGMTPSAGAVTQTLGAPGGRGQQARLAVFARGLRVYQLLVVGPRADAPAWDGFLGSLQLGERQAR